MSAGNSEAEAATREGGGAPPTLSFDGLGFDLDLPPKLPFRVLRSIAENNDNEPGQVVAILADILGEGQADRVWASDLDLEAGRELLSKLLELYGIGQGESSASPSS